MFRKISWLKPAAFVLPVLLLAALLAGCENATNPEPELESELILPLPNGWYKGSALPSNDDGYGIENDVLTYYNSGNQDVGFAGTVEFYGDNVAIIKITNGGSWAKPVGKYYGIYVDDVTPFSFTGASAYKDGGYNDGMDTLDEAIAEYTSDVSGYFTGSGYAAGYGLYAGTSTVTGIDASLEVAWGAVSGATGYDVYYTDTTTPPTSTTNAITTGVAINGTAATITGLINGTAYNVWVRAKDASKTGAWVYQGSGTPSEFISIANAADLAKIGNDATYPLSGKYRLAANITLTDWTPIGNSATPFAGEFDGNDKSITLQSFANTALAEQYIGVFGYVKGASNTAKAEIKNLVIQSGINQPSTSTTRQAIGTLVGYAENTEIENITLNGSFTFGSTKTVYAGGIAGYIQTGTVVKDTTVNADLVIAPGNAGDNLTGTPAQAYSYVGGVVGIFVNGGEILNCHNTGDIQAFSDVSSSQVFAGGIAGGSYYGYSTGYQGKIEDCSYTGDLQAKAKGSWTFAGGLAGTIVGGTTTDINSTTRIVRSFATGTISVAGTSSGNPYIGGIVGYNYYGALVSQCCFTGNVTADKTGDYTGGIAGYNSQTTTPNNSRIEDCWSSGTVTGFNNAGGIVGQNQVNTYLRRCYSTAVVTTTDTGTTGTGGIAGMNASVMTDALTACVALNLSLQNGNSANIHRITGGSTGTNTNNYAWSGMTITTTGTPTTDADKEGADCAAKPDITVYRDTLGWDFTNVWIMGNDGYPVLKWQTP
jgi:hypothetical protein